ncbi:unnamed protein product [Phytomonas sp. Hart1]|nr:unnamed protein product [Phytomonas sp. Hart1]|eukprot:CCW70301.1 unnamed protein product [Phytomonas sp. isolate Hart1]
MSEANGSDNVRYPMAVRTIATEGEILSKMAECAKRIANDYKAYDLSSDNPIILVCVLKGSFLFTADLCRFMADEGIPVKMEFICISSYGSGVQTSGQVRLLLDVRESVENRHVLIVEDIVDTATSLIYIKSIFSSKKPASLKSVVLLDKPNARKNPFIPDYSIFTVPNVFVVGYGLDYAESFRELRDVVELDKKYYSNGSHI